jgi:hypothetical protein
MSIVSGKFDCFFAVDDFGASFDDKLVIVVFWVCLSIKKHTKHKALVSNKK